MDIKSPKLDTFDAVLLPLLAKQVDIVMLQFQHMQRTSWWSPHILIKSACRPGTRSSLCYLTSKYGPGVMTQVEQWAQAELKPSPTEYPACLQPA